VVRLRSVEYGWSRNVLMNMMMNTSMVRTGTAPSNFVQQLVAPDSELAQQVAKDPYNFEFLGLSGEVAERDLENALTSRITETLQELGPALCISGLCVFASERAVGLDPEAARDFLAQGMLMNTLSGIRLPEIYENETAEELLGCTLRAKLPIVLRASRAQRQAS
jgi:hypothetical protein